MAQLLGIIEAVWNGQQIPLKPNSTFSLGGVTSKPQVYGSQVGFSNATEPSEAALNVAVEKGSSIYATFPAGVAGELQIICDTGQQYIWPDAFRSGRIEMSSGDNSEAKVTFAGGTPTEVINS